MLAAVFRLYACGQPLDRDKVRAARPHQGQLFLRLRLTGRRPGWDDVYLATLERGEQYVIPCLDRARVVEIKERWVHLVGTEVVPRSTSLKRPNPDRYRQEWWCRLAEPRPGVRP